MSSWIKADSSNGGLSVEVLALLISSLIIAFSSCERCVSMNPSRGRLCKTYPHHAVDIEDEWLVAKIDLKVIASLFHAY